MKAGKNYLYKILFVVRGGRDEAASSKYRVFQFLPYCEKNGISYRLIEPPRRRKVLFYLWAPWMVKLLFYGLYSERIFVQKDIFCCGFWKAFKKLHKKIIYDFDDAIFLPNEPKKDFVYAFPPRRGSNEALVTEMVRTSDLVIVANTYLERFSRRVSGRTFLLPMCLDLDGYSLKVHSDSSPVVVGWIGSPQTVPFLSLVKDALTTLRSRYGDRVRFKMVTNGRVPMNGLDVEIEPWSPLREIEQILTFDIGIVPLPGDAFTQGKSSFKLLQFMACSLPTVSSAVGFNKEVIVHGENGFIAGDERDWVEMLSCLIEDRLLRENVGKAARKTVEEGYSLESTAPRFLEAIMSA